MFKVGDRVRVISPIKNGYTGKYRVGDVTEIDYKDMDGTFQLGGEKGESACWVVDTTCLELVEEKEEEEPISTDPKLVLKIGSKYYTNVDGKSSCRTCDLHQKSDICFCQYGTQGENHKVLPCQSITAFIGTQQIFKEVLDG